jgi:hypothetical protein
MRRLPRGVYPEPCEILRGVYPELAYILRQAQNEREKELDENSEGLRMTGGEGLAITERYILRQAQNERGN